jgi:hypothetical protein
MARIRSIKPEFFRSVTISTLTFGARLTFEGLWCYADDDGRYRYEPGLLKGDVWPLDGQVTADQVASWADELLGASLLCEYEAGGRRYLHITNWQEHQVIKNPSKPKWPGCPRDQHGGKSTPALPHISPSPTPLEVEVEVEEEEENYGGAKAPVESNKQTRPSSVGDVRQVFDTWTATLPPGTRRQLSPTRRKTIQARLREFGLQDCLDAVVGWRNDPWPGRAEQNDITILFRPGNFEKMRDYARNGPPARAAPPSRSQQQLYATYQAMDDWAKEVDSNAGNGMAGHRREAQRELPRPGDQP